MEIKKVDANQPYYVYKFSDGTKVTLRAGEKGVTQLDIKELNLAYNREVESNLKNLRPRRTKEEKLIIKAWEEKYIHVFIEQHGYKPHPDDVRAASNEHFPRNYNLSLNAFDDECEEGKNPIQKAVFEFSKTSDENPEVERLHEILPLLTKDQQWLINRIYVDGVSQVEIAQELGTTKQAIHSRLVKIHKRIKKLF